MPFHDRRSTTRAGCLLVKPLFRREFRVTACRIQNKGDPAVPILRARSHSDPVSGRHPWTPATAWPLPATCELSRGADAGRSDLASGVARSQISPFADEYDVCACGGRTLLGRRASGVLPKRQPGTSRCPVALTIVKVKTHTASFRRCRVGRISVAADPYELAPNASPSGDAIRAEQGSPPEFSSIASWVSFLGSILPPLPMAGPALDPIPLRRPALNKLPYAPAPPASAPRPPLR